MAKKRPAAPRPPKKKGPGRPPKPPAERRENQPGRLSLKLTPAERRTLDEAVAKLGEPITPWARAVLLRAAERILRQ